MYEKYAGTAKTDFISGQSCNHLFGITKKRVNFYTFLQPHFLVMELLNHVLKVLVDQFSFGFNLKILKL